MTFSFHIKALTSRLSRNSSIIYCLRDLVPKKILKTLYYSHIYPHLNYCNVIWANTYKSHIDPLIKIQKRIIRNISKADFLAHTQPLFKEHSILPVNDIIELNLGILMYKNISTNVIPMARVEHRHFTRQRDELRPRRHKLTLYSKSFMKRGFTVWNKLSLKLRNSTSLL